MKIMICGSMAFAKEMLAAKRKIEAMGYEAQIPLDARQIIDGRHDYDDLEADYNHCLKNDVLKTHFKILAESDAILVLNYDKDGIKGYIGASSLMEIGLAYYLGKKIFLWQPTPHHSEQRWAHEIRIIQPIILDGDLNKIKKYE